MKITRQGVRNLSVYFADFGAGDDLLWNANVFIHIECYHMLKTNLARLTKFG